MGVATVTAGRIYAAQRQGKRYGEESSLAFESFPHVGLAKVSFTLHRFSCSSREEVTDIPKLHGPNYPDITDLGISTQGVEKLLSNLNVSKASGPDLILCRLLKGLAEEIAPTLA